MLKIFSWNVNGLRAVIRKGALQNFISFCHPDILCLQETKAKRGQAEIDATEYEEFWNSAERPGYAGTAIFVRNGIPVVNVYHDFAKYPDLTVAPDEFGDPMTEGRILTLEFEQLFVVTVYVPNSKNALERLTLREREWDPALREYLTRLNREKPVAVCGDFNAAHEEIDLARPKVNHHNAGFTDEERSGITQLIGAGFTDTFRHLYPDTVRYTWWSHWGHARENNVGWRIDYFFISKPLLPHLKSAEIYESVTGSDHCPISITLEL
ncbi:exodeoxyribonuclease III [Candidatus Saccharibacteria bacterium]|nr:exodeoxyribonuclease III [Candidatus Saccharibacteria bacterium]